MLGSGLVLSPHPWVGSAGAAGPGPGNTHTQAPIFFQNPAGLETSSEGRMKAAPEPNPDSVAALPRSLTWPTNQTSLSFSICEASPETWQPWPCDSAYRQPGGGVLVCLHSSRGLGCRRGGDMRISSPGLPLLPPLFSSCPPAPSSLPTPGSCTSPQTGAPCKESSRFSMSVVFKLSAYHEEFHSGN